MRPVISRSVRHLATLILFTVGFLYLTACTSSPGHNQNDDMHRRSHSSADRDRNQVRRRISQNDSAHVHRRKRHKKQHRRRMRQRHDRTEVPTSENNQDDTASRSTTESEPKDSDSKLERIETGRTTYEKYCSSCHGPDRKGNPPRIPSIDDVNERLSDDEIIDVINQGPGQMPSFGYLSKSRKDAIATFLMK